MSTTQSSRTRRCHGQFSIGRCGASVHSSRSTATPGVIVDITADGVLITNRLSAVQARACARALWAAAEAIDASQRFVRGAA